MSENNPKWIRLVNEGLLGFELESGNLLIDYAGMHTANVQIPPETTIAAAQLRAARAMLNWSREEAASQCGVSLNTIARLETDERAPTARLMVSIVDGFAKHGVLFKEDPGGVGVYLRTSGLKAAATGVR